MLNRATVMGHVGKDPDVRSTQAGNKVATFSVATSERWTDKTTGEQKEHTEWHRIVVWGDVVVEKLIAPNVKKGSKIYIEGQMRTREYEAKDGIKRYTTEVVVQGNGSVIRLLDPSERKGPPPVEAPPPGRPVNGEVNGYHAPASGPPEPPVSAYDEIPF